MRRTPGARIVPAAVDFDDLQKERGFVNLAWALDPGRRLEGSGLTCNAVLPGAFVRTDATREFPPGFRPVLVLMGPLKTSPARAAAVVVHVATAPDLASVSGEVFVKGKTGSEPALARDPAFVRRVREERAKLTGVAIEGG